MKVLTLLGTRPEIIRLSRVIPLLDARCQHVLVHTGQNFDERLSDVFFAELGLRAPDHVLGIRGSFGAQLGCLLPECERLLVQHRPDRFLVLGDTNSALAALVAKRLGIPVYHMEAGNRCFDERVPEELNRRVVDHASDVLLPYTERSRQNLLREGIPPQKIYVTGNPIYEVLTHYAAQIGASDVLWRLGLAAGAYFLVTLHRAENVDQPERFSRLLEALGQLQAAYGVPVIVSTHPRTRQRLGRRHQPPGGGHASPSENPLHESPAAAPPHAALAAAALPPDVRFCAPFGLFDFVALEQQARCVLTDSGTVQEECAILRVPNVTLRDVTERPETVECGSNLLAGSDPQQVLACVAAALARPRTWNPPPEYLVPDVSHTVAAIVLGYYQRP